MIIKLKLWIFPTIEFIIELYIYKEIPLRHIISHTSYTPQWTDVSCDNQTTPP